MRHPTPHHARLYRHGNIYAPDAGSMIIHAQRERGDAHRTVTLRPWQVRVLYLFTTRWMLIGLAAALLSSGFIIMQAARVPILLGKLHHLERDHEQLDSLRRAVMLLQQRYVQVQRMLVAPAPQQRDARTAFPPQPARLPATELKTAVKEETRK